MDNEVAMQLGTPFILLFSSIVNILHFYHSIFSSHFCVVLAQG